jgi:DNA topoisomerase-2
MAIWSLTQERVEKLLKQIGEKELEIDALIKLSPKDIWTQDLDDFVAEWNTQIVEEGQRAKKLASIGRRASHKLGIGAAKGGKRKKKRADDSDSESQSDYGPAKKKAKPKAGGLLSYLHKDSEEPKKPSATAALKNGAATAKKQTGMLGYLKKETPPVVGLDDTMDIDEPAPVPILAAVSKRSRSAATKKPTKLESDSVHSDSDSDVFAAVAKEAEKKPARSITTSRTARGATKKATNYSLDRDSDSNDMEDDDFDVSNMVKTIGSSSNDRPLFSTTARPGSNGGARPGSATGGPAKTHGRGATSKPTPLDIDDPDETNYEGLMPQGSPHKPAPRNVNDTIMGSDESDDLGFGLKKKVAAKPAAVKAAFKSKAGPKPKSTVPSAVATKQTQLSPAAKAYAARLDKKRDLAASKPAPKARRPIASDSDDEDLDDVDKLASEILSDDEEDEPTPKPATARVGRRATAKPARYVVSDDDDESDAASEPSYGEDDSG